MNEGEERAFRQNIKLTLSVLIFALVLTIVMLVTENIDEIIYIWVSILFYLYGSWFALARCMDEFGSRSNES